MVKETPERFSLFNQQIRNIDRILLRIIQRGCPSEDEGDEFRSFAYLRLLANDCRILQAFKGKSQWSTYLTVILQRLFLDFRDHRWGRWRPCSAAKRRGREGILLDRLVRRDRLGIEEAILVLQNNHGVSVPADDLRHWAQEFPRWGRPIWVRETNLDPIPSLEPTDAGILAKERGEQAAQIHRALRRAIARLSAEGRLILKMRYQEGLKVSEIARVLGKPQKPLYREIDSILRKVKRLLIEAGCSEEETLEFLSGS